MSNIVDFSIHRKNAKQLTVTSSLYLLEEIVSELFDSFSVKWTIKAHKSIWVPYWASVIHDAGVDYGSLSFASRLCLEQEDVLPTVFFFVHVCGLYSDFKRFDLD